MPKTIKLTEHGFDGIDVTYTKSTQKLVIGGWFDSICGIKGQTLTLREFLERLGITEKDIARALKSQSPIA